MIDEAIVAQSAHVFSDDTDVEVMEVLLRHFGEQTAMGMSINARPATICLSRCLVSMLVSFETSESLEVVRAIEAAVISRRKAALDEFQRSGRA